jgi:tRNA(adenine34) deaminase
MREDAAEHLDRVMMRHCIACARDGVRAGEFPFACVIARDEEMVASRSNRSIRDGDVTRHAEMLALSDAQQVLGRASLSGCTLYTTVEPCAMCSFALREAQISRVVFAIYSPLMGGQSRWDVLTDTALSGRMGEVFAPPPEVRGGVLVDDVARLWRRAKPLAWGVIRWRGIFRLAPHGASATAVSAMAPPAADLP